MGGCDTRSRSLNFKFPDSEGEPLGKDGKPKSRAGEEKGSALRTEGAYREDLAPGGLAMDWVKG